MNTEITQENDATGVRGWIFYDAECQFCVNVRDRIGPVFEHRRFKWLSIKSTQARELLGDGIDGRIDQMKLRLSDGSTSGGVEAWKILCCSVWWLWICGWLMGLPGLSQLANAGYRLIARNRYCFNGRCAIRRENS